MDLEENEKKSREKDMSEALAQDVASEEFTEEELSSAVADQEPEPDSLALDLKRAEKEIESLKEEMAQLKDRALRALAEAENMRKRSVKEKEDASKYAVSSFARDLLDVADNFRRAIDSASPELLEGDEHVKNLISGIESVEKVMLGVFDRHGIRKLEPESGAFDPNFHEVMFEAPVPGKASGEIIQLIEPGYVLNGRLLRPARVGVARNDEGTEMESGSNIDTEA